MCRFADPRQHATRGLLVLALLMLAGCASTPAPIVEAPIDEPVAESEAPVDSIAPEEPLPEDEEARTFALPEESGAVIDPSAPVDAATTPQPAEPAAAPPRTSSPAVVALIDAAAAQASSGDADQAAATLERALRIEPSNATLWHRLAVLRMQQGQYEQAMELAMRSNSLARGDAALLDANRQVLEQCRAALARTQRG
jgi:tetratricopeptide (TPR) repeat protein